MKFLSNSASASRRMFFVLSKRKLIESKYPRVCFWDLFNNFSHFKLYFVELVLVNFYIVNLCSVHTDNHRLNQFDLTPFW